MMILSYSSFLTTGSRIPVSYQIVGDNGTVASPNFPNYYPHYIIRRWNITVPSGKQIKLSFSSFYLASASVICDWDFVQIQDGPLASSDVIVRMCGQLSPGKTVFSSCRHLQIYFETDASLSNTGFQASFEAVSKQFHLFLSRSDTKVISVLMTLL